MSAPDYRASRAILELGPDFFDAVEPAPFPAHILRYRNDRAARSVGLAGLSDADWIAYFGRFQPLPDNLPQPLALRYHGHQFRTYNPELGDGRGFLFAQLLDGERRLMDLGTKGSGRTPWSRSGDGRLTLKGGVREILATEMLEALGVTTSRSFSLIETGEALERGDEPSPTRSSVLVRLSHSHIRYGSFQRLAALEQPANLEKLTLYALEHVARRDPGADPYATLMHYAVEGAARLVAEWHVAGFVHGVLNTDNMNISGESFDYGPWRFLPRWEAGFTAAYFDHFGLYAFGRQAEALHWNLVELAKALRHVAQAESLLPALHRWPELVAQAVRRQALWRLGLKRAAPEAEESLVRAFEVGMAESGLQPDAVWFAFRGGRIPSAPHPAFGAFLEALAGFEPLEGALDHAYWGDAQPATLLIDEVEALWEPIASRDDWSALDLKIAAVRRMGEALAGTA
ncbi:YdiU family protein [Sandaracinobacter sp. RS1-74]|uniref:protein adenylyltransferase SelO family protein n=1 Tax=Sandaracinobacteroides sayramensis TaxID=2913411 RepID=UPI001EDB4F3C|nr:YdiU family protein [Sandaracinobacteroides sayramensis]MCG2841948.1 YdiU family protein [Sandaracinobacteroides sayramensis]